MGTRFIATTECQAHDDYKNAILRAEADDIVLTEKISGVPVAVIQTRYVKKMGTHAGPVARRLLQHPKTKHWMRSYYSLVSLWKLRKSMHQGAGYQEYFQAGKSVAGVARVEPAGDIVRRFATAAEGLVAVAPTSRKAPEP
jgi:nitronate monooxygenase